MHRKKKFTVIQGNKKKKRPVEKLIYFLLAAALGLLLLQMGYSFARDALASALVKTVLSEEGVLEQAVTVRGILVRDEHVVAAPLTGTVRWVIDDGERLAVGASVAAISSPGASPKIVTTPTPGIVVLHLDGLEGALQPQGLSEINIGQMLKTSEKKPHKIAGGEEVHQGTMLFKVVNNFGWYFAAEMTPAEYAELEDMSSVAIRFSFAPEEETRGTVMVLKETEEFVRVAFQLKEDVPGFSLERFAEAELLVRRSRGILLPASALVHRGEETGVYILEKSVVRYRPVDVLEKDGELIVISGVRKGAPVITNPTLVREGLRL